MKNCYENSFNLRTSDFSQNNAISPAAVLDFFQEVAGAHAELLCCGFEEMLKKGQLWVVIRARYKVINELLYHTPITVRTWPLSPSRIGFQREYQIFDYKGELSVIGSTDWVIMSDTQRKLLPVGDIYPKDLTYIEEKVFEGRNKRLRDFDGFDDEYSVLAKYSDIDLNGHVNNAKYAVFVMDAVKLKTDEKIDEMQIDFHREIKMGEEIKILTKRSENEIFAKGVSPDGEMYFNCKIILK